MRTRTPSVSLAAALTLTLLAPARGQSVDAARETFPPQVTMGVLRGDIPAPAGFDERIAGEIGAERLAEFRSGERRVTGLDNDCAALVLTELGVDPSTLLAARPGGRRGDSRAPEVEVQATNSSYRVAPGGTSGFFETGQDADRLLSGIDFDESGGPLLFNHPMGIASDGRRLALADTYNHRVLVWNSLPDGNVPPDLVLGQSDFHANSSGDALDRMNWPVTVSIANDMLLVADAYNDRILVWREWPATSGEAADLAITGGERGARRGEGRAVVWPWGLWTDGERLAVSSTSEGTVLLWDHLPVSGKESPDRVLRGEGDLGTPRSITSDGRSLVVGDHNPRVESARSADPMMVESGTFFWRSWPTRDDQPYDFFRGGNSRGPEAWLRGDTTSDGRFVLLGGRLQIWDSLPRSAKEDPALALDFSFRSGDHTGVAVAGERVYVCSGNWNKVFAFRSVPRQPDQRPDFVLGAPDLETDTLATNFIVSNPAPVSNGKSLFVGSDFDGKLYVWKSLPDQSGAAPDFVYTMSPPAGQLAVHGNVLVALGREVVHVWKSLPVDGRLPDQSLTGELGGVELSKIRGLAMDDRHVYLSDWEHVYVYAGFPDSNTRPEVTIEAEGSLGLSSDGEYLVVAAGDKHEARIYRVADLSARSRPAIVGGRGDERLSGLRSEMRFNMVMAASASHGSLFLADSGNHRVLVWRRIEDAIAGKDADLYLGAEDGRECRPGTTRDQLSSPAGLSFDGNYLWIGERKFSERLLRFSPIAK